MKLKRIIFAIYLLQFLYPTQRKQDSPHLKIILKKKYYKMYIMNFTPRQYYYYHLMWLNHINMGREIKEKQIILVCLIQWIITDQQPFNVVEDSSFHNFIMTLDKHYWLQRDLTEWPESCVFRKFRKSWGETMTSLSWSDYVNIQIPLKYQDWSRMTKLTW